MTVTSLTTFLVIISRPKSAAVNGIDIAEMLHQKFQYRINVGKGDIDTPLVHADTRVQFLPMTVGLFMYS